MSEPKVIKKPEPKPLTGRVLYARAMAFINGVDDGLIKADEVETTVK